MFNTSIWKVKRDHVPSNFIRLISVNQADGPFIIFWLFFGSMAQTEKRPKIPTVNKTQHRKVNHVLTIYWATPQQFGYTSGGIEGQVDSAPHWTSVGLYGPWFFYIWDFPHFQST